MHNPVYTVLFPSDFFSTKRLHCKHNTKHHTISKGAQIPNSGPPFSERKNTTQEIISLSLIELRLHTHGGGRTRNSD